LLALLSHLALDYSNNYGLRPFFPFDPRWYAGSFVFIFDPVILALLLLAFVAPPLFALVGAELGARKQRFRGRGWAIAALLGVAAWWSLRAVEHGRAEQIAAAQSMAVAPAEAGPDTPLEFAQPVRVQANPDPFSPFRWHAVSDFGEFYQLAEIDLLNGSLTPAQDIHFMPARTPAVLAAEASPLGRVYMDWSPMPFIAESPPGDPTRVATNNPSDTRFANSTIVTFRDPRFMIDLPLLRGRSDPPLTGTVALDAQNRVVRQTMDGDVQR
ncbi:MAG: metal-dependent hydrolase, partial [Acidobacteriota bacterium]|nr:metal-dependent hydrolase [Acidobacteriota bacterium]